MTAQSFSVYLFGAKAVSPSSLTTLLFSYPIHANSTSQMSHVAKVAGQIRDRGRRLFWAVGLSFVATTLVVIIGTLYLGYTGGAENFGHGFICGGVHNFPGYREQDQGAVRRRLEPDHVFRYRRRGHGFTDFTPLPVSRGGRSIRWGSPLWGRIW